MSAHWLALPLAKHLASLYAGSTCVWGGGGGGRWLWFRLLTVASCLVRACVWLWRCSLLCPFVHLPTLPPPSIPRSYGVRITPTSVRLEPHRATQSDRDLVVTLHPGWVVHCIHVLYLLQHNAILRGEHQLAAMASVGLLSVCSKLQRQVDVGVASAEDAYRVAIDAVRWDVAASCTALWVAPAHSKSHWDLTFWDPTWLCMVWRGLSMPTTLSLCMSLLACLGFFPTPT